MLDPDLESFVGCFEIPLRHGMTFGELATMANGERKLGLDLARGRDARLGARRLVRFHRPALGESVAQYAQPECGHALSRRRDAGSFQELFGGRGTDALLSKLGADWIHGRELAAFLKRPLYSGRAGLSDPVSAQQSSNFCRKDHRRRALRGDGPGRVRQHAAGPGTGLCARKLYPGKIALGRNRFLIGNQQVIAGGKERRRPANDRAENARNLSPLSSSGERNTCFISSRWQPEPGRSPSSSGYEYPAPKPIRVSALIDSATGPVLLGDCRLWPSPLVSFFGRFLLPGGRPRLLIWTSRLAAVRGACRGPGQALQRHDRLFNLLTLRRNSANILLMSIHRSPREI